MIIDYALSRFFLELFVSKFFQGFYLLNLILQVKKTFDNFKIALGVVMITSFGFIFENMKHENKLGKKSVIKKLIKRIYKLYHSSIRRHLAPTTLFRRNNSRIMRQIPEKYCMQLQQLNIEFNSLIYLVNLQLESEQQKEFS